MRFMAILIICCGFSAGCAAVTPKSLTKIKPVESTAQQIDAAQKVMGAMAGQEIARKDLERVGRDLQKNEESRSAVRKIIGDQPAAVIKYSPRTGKHYNSDLEFDPETGVRLEVLE